MAALARSMVLVGGLLAAAPLQAADLPPYGPVRERTYVETRYHDGIVVVVDETFLSAGCPRRRDCIAPRVLPIRTEDDRRVNYVGYRTPVDPRFADLYVRP